jgi:hypothetical protein
MVQNSDIRVGAADPNPLGRELAGSLLADRTSHDRRCNGS